MNPALPPPDDPHCQSRSVPHEAIGRAISFRVETQSGTILTKARGVVCLADILAHIHTKTKADLHELAEVFDARDVVLDFASADLPKIAHEMRQATEGKAPAKIALITNSAFVYGLARAYADLTGQDRALFQVFADMESARSWAGSKSDSGQQPPENADAFVRNTS